MTVIGLTGGIASGKSTAAEMLRELGAVIIDADRLGHRSYEPGTPGFEKVVNAFGHDIVGKDGVIDRRVLGGKVFGAPGQMERLNAIVWPEIRNLIQDEIHQVRGQDREAIIVLEAAVLLEAGWEDLCNEIWVVTTTTAIAVERLRSRNNLTEEAAMARINSQMSNKERNDRATVKIENTGSEEQLHAKVERAWAALMERVTPRRKAPASAAAKPAATKAAATRSTAARRETGRPATRAAAAPAGATATKRATPKAATKAPAGAAAPAAGRRGSAASRRAAAKSTTSKGSDGAKTPATRTAAAGASRARAATPAKGAAARPATHTSGATTARGASAAPAARKAPASRNGASSGPARAGARGTVRGAARATAKPSARTGGRK